MEDKMLKRSVLITSWLVSGLTIGPFADFSVLETPYAIVLNNAVCKGDYIWYTFTYLSDYGIPDDEKPVRVGKLHIPTKQNQIFEVGYGKYENSQIAAVGSSHIAVYPKDYRHYKNVFYYNGSNWKTFTNVFPFLKKVLSLPSGKILLLSVDSLGLIESDTVKKISRLDLGVDHYLVDMGTDSAGTAWIISKNHIISCRDSEWKTEFIGDSMIEFKEVRKNIDGSIRFISSNGDYTLVNGVLNALPDSGEVYSDQCVKDKSNRIWKMRKHNSSRYNKTDSLQMSYQGTLMDYGNAEKNGWENWPALAMYEHHSLTTSNNHVIVVSGNGFYHYAGNGKKVWEWIPLIEISEKEHAISNIIFSLDSAVYFARNHNRIFKYKSGKYISLPNLNHFSSLFVDRRNTLWLLSGGLRKWQDHLYSPVSFEGISAFNHITEDNSGNMILLSIWGDIIRKNGLTVEIINDKNSNIPPFQSGAIVQTKDGKYWLRTSMDSIFQSSDMFKWEYVDLNKIPPNRVYELIATSKGNLIVAENWAGRIFKYDGIQWINLGTPETNVVNSIFRIVIREDDNGNIWYGSSRGRSGMLAIYRGTEWRILEADLCVNDIQFGPNNQVWLATDKGLRVYNSQITEIGGKYFSQHGNSPNLAIKHSGKGKTTIEYTVDKPCLINLSMYTSQGKKITTLKNGFHGKGSYRLFWENSVARGNYILLLATPGNTYAAGYANY